MLQTYQTKLKNLQLNEDKTAFDYLNAFGERFGILERKLFVLLHIHNSPSNEVKTSFSKKYGLTSRQYNALKFQLDGKVKSIVEVRNFQLEQLKGKIKEIESFIKRKEKQKERTFKKLQKIKQSDEAFKDVVKKYRTIKFVLHQKKRKLRNVSQKLEKLLVYKKEKRIPICFGSKELFHKQFHLEENGLKDHKEWKEKWIQARSSQFMALGSKDETFGNQTATYDLENNLRLRVANSFEELFGKYITFPNVRFPYGQKHLDKAKMISKGFTKSGKEKRYFRAITYRFIKKEAHWYVYATVEIDVPKVTTTHLNGSIGIDFNAGFLSICEIDRFGNPLKEWTIKVPMYDRKSEQVKASLGDAIKEIIEYAKKVGKPIAFEDLDFTKKKQQLGEVSRKYARMLSGFGYSNFKEILQSKSKREGTQTVPVNPAFTSQIGHMKFMGRYGLSSHGSAACMIARKAYKFGWEKPNYTTVLGLPKTFDKEKKNYSNWLSLSKYTKNKFYFNDKIELLKADR